MFLCVYCFFNFLMFLKIFFMFLKMFLCFLMFFVLKNTNVQNYKYDLFLMGTLRSAAFDLYIQYIPVLSLYKW